MLRETLGPWQMVSKQIRCMLFICWSSRYGMTRHDWISIQVRSVVLFRVDADDVDWDGSPRVECVVTRHGSAKKDGSCRGGPRHRPAEDRVTEEVSPQAYSKSKNYEEVETSWTKRKSKKKGGTLCIGGMLCIPIEKKGDGFTNSWWVVSLQKDPWAERILLLARGRARPLVGEDVTSQVVREL